MFDRLPDPDIAKADAREAVERLCVLYDRLVDEGEAAGLSEAAAAELRAMARIYDLNTDRSDADVWRDLRPVLVNQTPVRPLDTGKREPDAETAADLTAALTEAGHSVVGPFHHAEAAEAAVALHAIDLALLDINLSGETDGIELAQTLKGRWGLPVLFLSGDATAADRNAGLAEALVLKPYTSRQVLEAIARVTARA